MAVLTISREFESGAYGIASALAEHMGYQYVGKKIFLECMNKEGEQWEKLFYDLDESTPSIWEKNDREYSGFIALMESCIYDYALRDRVIIIGRGGNFLLHDIPHVLRIRLTALHEKRVEQVMLKEYVDNKTAEWLIEKVDRGRAGYVNANYHKYWYDFKYYDMVFNTGSQSHEEIVKILANALHERDTHATPYAKDLLMGRALSAKIKAMVAMDQKLLIPTIEVFYDGKAIVLRGVVRNLNDSRRIEEMACTVAEGKPLRNELRLRK
jgi:cytidylate kinase